MKQPRDLYSSAPVRYTAAFVDYLDSEVEKYNGDWEKVAIEHLYSGDEMLLNGLCGGRKSASQRIDPS